MPGSVSSSVNSQRSAVDFVEAAVEEQRQRPLQALDDLGTIEERGGNRGLAIGTGDSEEFPVAEQLLHTAGGDAETGGDIWNR